MYSLQPEIANQRKLTYTVLYDCNGLTQEDHRDYPALSYTSLPSQLPAFVPLAISAQYLGRKSTLHHRINHVTDIVLQLKNCIPARPTEVELAIEIASSSVPNLTSGATGPNVSINNPLLSI